MERSASIAAIDLLFFLSLFEVLILSTLISPPHTPSHTLKYTHTLLRLEPACWVIWHGNLSRSLLGLPSRQCQIRRDGVPPLLDSFNQIINSFTVCCFTCCWGVFLFVFTLFYWTKWRCKMDSHVLKKIQACELISDEGSVMFFT